ncbi:MAG: ABC transporter permease, partial [Thermoplasmata archaeon]|nr:ABC transporter permease [Thermoplasmata archaeon]
MAALDPLVVLLLLILVGVVALSLALGLRHPLPFRIGMRNVRRGRSRTILLILGLLVGTTIISGSLVVGDTVNQLDLHYTYLALGYVDETIYNETPTGSHVPFAYSTYTAVATAMASDPSVTGVTPMLVATAQALDRTTHIPQTNLHLIGVNGAQSGQLGPFVTDAGTSLAGPETGHVIVDDLAAASMNTSAGDTLVLYGAGALPLVLTVQGVVRDDLRGGFLTGGVGDSGGLFVDLPTAQNLTNLPGEINFLAISNVGSQKSGVALSEAVSARLNTTVAGIPTSGHLVVHEELKDALATAASSGSSLSTLFLVLGLFSIVAGAMLIVGIFV